MLFWQSICICADNIIIGAYIEYLFMNITRMMMMNASSHRMGACSIFKSSRALSPWTVWKRDLGLHFPPHKRTFCEIKLKWIKSAFETVAESSKESLKYEIHISFLFNC